MLRSPIGQPSVAGEYDASMQVFLQLVWGDGFLSPGGAEEVARLLKGSDISGCHVLDIGCGLGAIDQLLVSRHGAGSVIGIDIDPVLLHQMDARIEHAGLGDRIRSQLVEPGPLPFADTCFDVVFSKDSLVQIPEKTVLFAEVNRVLRPGGRFIASDWLRAGQGAFSVEMVEFFRLEGIAYNMASLAQSVAALQATGFAEIEGQDRNDWYLELARRELSAIEGALKPVILKAVGVDRTEHFIANWRQLVVVLARGELRPTDLKAVRPR
jgi:ubiquinone/menaquinone biosynthesis C-methylase UbiE